MIIVYVDDMNLIRTLEELSKTVEYLNEEFDVKDLGKIKFCLGLELEYKQNKILFHQSSYIEKIVKRFNMDKAHPLSTHMVIRSL